MAGIDMDGARSPVIIYLALTVVIVTIATVLLVFFGGLAPDILTPVPVAGGGTGLVVMNTESGPVTIIAIVNPTKKVLSFTETAADTEAGIPFARCILVPPDGHRFLVPLSGSMTMNRFGPGNLVHIYYDGTYQEDPATGEITAGFWLTNDIWARKRLTDTPIVDILSYPGSATDKRQSGEARTTWTVLLLCNQTKNVLFEQAFSLQQ